MTDQAPIGLVYEPVPPCPCGDDPCPANCPNRIDRERTEEDS